MCQRKLFVFQDIWVQKYISSRSSSVCRFSKSYSDKKNNLLQNKKSCDASLLAPSKVELIQQIRRTAYICSIWCNAHLQAPSSINPEEYGWSLENENYVFNWFEGDIAPKEIEDVVLDEPNEVNEQIRRQGKKLHIVIKYRFLSIILTKFIMKTTFSFQLYGLFTK